MDFLEKYGNIKHCYEVHKQVMLRNHEPFVTYETFRYRLKNLGWDMYKAIHTPAIVEKRDKDRRRKVWFKVLGFKIRHFFRRLFNLGCSDKK